MNGSIKQVEWAVKIKATMVLAVENMRRQFVNEATTNKADTESAEYKAVVTVFNRAIAKLNATTDAKWFIDRRNDVISRQWVKELGK